MSLPFPLIKSRSLVTDPTAWWKRGTRQYQNITATSPITAAGQTIARWDDNINLHSLQHSTGNRPTAHTDVLAASFVRGGGGVGSFLAGAAGLAAIVGGTNKPFTVMTRLKTHTSLSLAYNWFAWRDTGTPVANFSVHRLGINSSGDWNGQRRDSGGTSKAYPPGSGVAASTSTIYTYTQIFDGANANDYTSTSLTYSSVDLNVGNCPFDSLIMGCSDDQGGGGFEGLIWDEVIWDHAINVQTLAYWVTQLP